MSATFSGSSHIIGPKWSRIPLLTTGVLGLQIVWSVEMSYASPYLISLGLTKSLMSLVFIAGPLSGLIMQPLVGSLADRSTLRWGRRRPFIVAGTLVCVFGMMLLGFTRHFSNIFTSPLSHANDVLTIILATISIYLIDFSINAVQAMDRALIVDTLPSGLQDLGNAWASRMIGIGHVLGFFIGGISLAQLPFLSVFGKTQLQIFSVLTSFILAATHAITVIAVREKRLLQEPTSEGSRSVLKVFADLWTGVVTLHPIIRRICIIQFFSWLAWFPILFLSSVYVGDFYRAEHSMAKVIRDVSDEIDDAANLRGARAMFFNSLLAMTTSIIAPWFISESDPEEPQTAAWYKPKIHIATLWAVSQFLFGICMAYTFFVRTWQEATVVVALTGFSFAITQWAPFALIGQVIHDNPAAVPVPNEPETQALLQNSSSEGYPDETSRQVSPIRRRSAERGSNDSRSRSRESRISERSGLDDGDVHKAGVVLGIHNVFVVIPQFVMTGISSLVFAILEPGKGLEDPGAEVPGSSPGALHALNVRVGPGGTRSDSLGIIYRIGGVSAIASGVLAFLLSRQLQRRSTLPAPTT
ncbi:MFS general substrate transporter [Sistotremastrum niveocremeum HHB9708]|uniref:MFS general substrate transporter n=1 Tax=Sistotremastrum niveocremeum HHB9708 TaxID=1314777 RepID=A0A164XWJ8_9AGAM|nr:MFS general substrate transporter [Sistotremastrum niveocremeum HHB9708]